MESIKSAKDKDRDGSREKQGDKTHHKDRHDNSKVQRERSTDKDRRERRHRYLRSKAKEKYQDYKNNVKDGQNNKGRNSLKSPPQSKIFSLPLNKDITEEYSQEDQCTSLRSDQQSICVIVNGHCEHGENCYNPHPWRRYTKQRNHRDKEHKNENKEEIKRKDEDMNLATNLIHRTEYEIYKEGEENMDPYKCIVNTGCPKIVTGRTWMDAFTESKENSIGIKIRKENEKFRFGSSDIYKSE